MGVDYWVVEEGLSGRTAVWPDPIEGEHKSGKSYLLACIVSSDIDGIHFDAVEQQKLGLAVAAYIAILAKND